jgi:hypothetical protein
LCSEKNFLVVKSHVETEFLMPSCGCSTTSRRRRIVMLAGWLLACEGKVSQRVEHPELMQAQLEFDQVKKNRAAELQVGPSVVHVLSECSLRWLQFVE